MNEKKLYRSLTERKIAGVCGGLAEHFMIDPVIVRIIFVCLFFMGLSGGLIYIILWIVLPEQPREIYQGFQEPIKDEPINTDNEPINSNINNMENQSEQNNNSERKMKPANLTGGIMLITLGVLFLCTRFIPNIDFGDLWPVLLIVIGITIMFKGNAYRKRNKN